MALTNALVYLKSEIDNLLSSKINNVNSVADLVNITNPFDGQVVTVRSYYGDLANTYNASCGMFTEVNQTYHKTAY